MQQEIFKDGFNESVWRAAKHEIRNVLIDVAKRRKVISYSELVDHIQTCTLTPRDPHLAHMLGEISSEETAMGRGLLTVLVVHKTGDMRPGSGFFELAKSLGRNTADRDAFWIEELNKVYDTWSDNSTV